MIVRDYGTLGPAHQAPMDLTLTGDLFVRFDGRVSANGRGYTPDTGPARGLPANAGGGGGHGGIGGDGSVDGDQSGRPTYGSDTGPTDFGSGGGKDLDHGDLGGAGGGAIRLTVGGLITLEGAISADGSPGARTPAAAGAAAVSRSTPARAT
jgi:hypothetical protein